MTLFSYSHVSGNISQISVMRVFWPDVMEATLENLSDEEPEEDCTDNTLPHCIGNVVPHLCIDSVNLL